jgi:hypothetical protein
MATETVTTRGQAPSRKRPPKRLCRLATVVAPVVGVAILVGACGGTARTQASSGAPREWRASDVVHLAGLRRSHDLSYRITGHPECAALTLLLSTAEVQTYKDSGDVIVTNPDRSAGVKVNSETPSCRRLFAQAFSRVR